MPKGCMTDITRAQRSECRSGRVLLEEVGVRTDRLQLILAQAVQVFLTESLFVQKSPEDVCELRVSVVVFAVDLLTTLG